MTLLEDCSQQSFIRILVFLATSIANSHWLDGNDQKRRLYSESIHLSMCLEKTFFFWSSRSMIWLYVKESRKYFMCILHFDQKKSQSVIQHSFSTNLINFSDKCMIQEFYSSRKTTCYQKRISIITWKWNELHEEFIQ